MRRGAALAERPLAELLGDEHEVLAERGETRDDRVLRCLVDRRRVVAADAELEDGLALDPRRQPLEDVADVLDAEAAGLEPVPSRRHRVEQKTRQRLREEVRALRRHRLAAARHGEDVLDPWRAEDERRVRRATVDLGESVLEARRVADSVEAVAVDELDVELAFATVDDPDRAAAIPDRRRALVRRGPRAARERRRGSRHGSSSRAAREIRPIREDAMCRKELQARRRPSARRGP